MTGDAKARCEMAMMGFVTRCSLSEAEDCIKYVSKVLNVEPNNGLKEQTDFMIDVIKKYKYKILFMTCNKIDSMIVMSFLLDTGDLPKPFETDYGSGYPAAYCYGLNLTVPGFSEFGDCFFEKGRNGTYRRIS